MPDKTRNIHVFRLMEFTSTPPEVTNTIAQLNIRMTDVLIAVARLELRPDTPIFARRAVSPAKKADDSAQKTHCIDPFRLFRRTSSVVFKSVISPVQRR